MNASLFPLALQASRNFHQYFGADSVLIDASSTDTGEHGRDTPDGHSVVFALGANIKPCSVKEFPIEIKSDGELTVRQPSGRISRPSRGFDKPLGAIYIRPASSGIELVVWGSDEAMLRQSARLIPMLTGTGQPDFIIVTEEAMWKGVEGCHLGFFDAWWQVSKASVIS
jgi:hypothetical protein